MTEAEWLVCTDPRPMLDALSGRMCRRKLRLLICACCRRLWDLLTDERSKQAVEIAEHYADGSASDAELFAARRIANAAYQRARKQHGPLAFRLCGAAHLALQATAQRIQFDPRADEFLRGARERKEKTERIARSDLLRDILGNPFRQPTIEPLTVRWNSGIVRQIAQAIYDDRGFEQMPILADALEDAGCDNTDILRHCREPGAHVRGCWVVDVLLGKK